jgi:hypothetical protein
MPPPVATSRCHSAWGQVWPRVSRGKTSVWGPEATHTRQRLHKSYTHKEPANTSRTRTHTSGPLPASQPACTRTRRRPAAAACTHYHINTSAAQVQGSTCVGDHCCCIQTSHGAETRRVRAHAACTLAVHEYSACEATMLLRKADGINSRTYSTHTHTLSRAKPHSPRRAKPPRQAYAHTHPASAASRHTHAHTPSSVAAWAATTTAALSRGWTGLSSSWSCDC